jgi:hypothetical protein
MIVSTGCSQKNGSVGVVSEPVVTGTGILVDFEEQSGGLRDVNILLWRPGGYLVGDTRIGDMRLRDDGNAFRCPDMGVVFSLWVNGHGPSLGVVGWSRAE